MSDRAGKFNHAYRKALVPENANIRQILEAMNASGAMIACMVDAEDRLIGILTDGDLRRAFLKGLELDDSGIEWIVRNPVVADLDATAEELTATAERLSVRQIPLLDSSGVIGDIFVLSTFQERVHEQSLEKKSTPEIDSALFVLAGGKGMRLRSVVNDRPKPLALVGGRPILQTIIENAADAGFRKFFISVNYMADMIEQHLNSSTYSSLNIQLLRETEFLGTAGSLGLLPEELTSPLVVINGDILARAPLASVVDFHNQQNAAITCVVRPYRMVVPYGVVDIAAGLIKQISEKPSTTYFINTGIYVLAPHVLKLIKPSSYLDMPDLIGLAINSGLNVVPFAMHEFWVDIGKPSDYSKANEDFEKYFLGENNETTQPW